MVDTAELDALAYPFRVDVIHKKKKSLKASLLRGGPFVEKRIAILGGSTTNEVKDVLELFLLREGIQPTFYQSDYNRYYEDVMFPNEALERFAPEIVYVHTTQANITNAPVVADSREVVAAKLGAEMARFTSLWDRIRDTYRCAIIQNNFELPRYRVLGNLDFTAYQGAANFTMRLNLAFAEYAQTHQDFFINDINYLSASIGLTKWHDPTFWHAYKYAVSYDAIPLLAHNVARIVTAVCGKSKKCLVVDLDNTLWGGVIGDDGPERIKIGKETPVGEAFSAFQQYATELKRRGIALAVCSKNDPHIAAQGFAHPDSILTLQDFAAFKASWNPKHHALREIATEMNIGLDSLVFVDDNPVERDLIRREVPEIAVPELGSDVAAFISHIDGAGYFEPAVISAEDMERTKFYEANALRRSLETDASDYGEFLASLEMTAEIAPFTPKYLDRITQLINKTNQFNLTTKRCSASEVETMSRDPRAVTLYGRLKDKFGDNGLITAIAGSVTDGTLDIDLWVMSCRVIKRDMEVAMFDELVRECNARGVERIKGYYYPTAKNGLVADLLPRLGFTLAGNGEKGESVWTFDVRSDHQPGTRAIKVAR